MMKALIPALALLILNLTDGAPTKDKYVTTGEGASAYVNWQECETAGWWSGVSFSGWESVSKVLGNGKPETNKYAYVDAWYERWYDCSSVSMTRTYLWLSEPVPASTGVVINTNLKSGSVSATVQALLVTEVCAYVCHEYDDCGEDCTWCGPECPTEGTDTVYESADVTLKATFVGTGTPSPSSYRSTSHTPYGVFHYKSSGTSVDATMSLTFTVNGKSVIPTYADKSATLSTSKDGTFSKYVNGI